jgi:hypothetical protein
VNAPADVRETLEPLTDRKLIDHCAALRPTELRTPSDSIQHALCALASRWLALATEIAGHDTALDAITQAAAPTLKDAFGIGADSAAEMMIIVGDNPARLKSEAAFAKLCGACPGAGVNRCHEPTPALPRWPSTSRRGTLSHRDGANALASAEHRLRVAAYGRRSLQEGHHSLSEAVRRARDFPRHHEGLCCPPDVTFTSV